MVQVREGDRLFKMSTEEAMFRKLKARILSGDAKAFAAYLEIAKKLGTSPLSEDRPVSTLLTLQNGHFLENARLSAPKGSFGSNPGNSETKRRAKSHAFAGFLANSGAKNRETGLLGWRASVDRTSLQRHSLLTGNFTGNFAE